MPYRATRDTLVQLETPLERYTVHGRDVYVKREDKQGDGIILPPWGKLAALDALLAWYQPGRRVGVVSVRLSFSGWAFVKLAMRRGLWPVVFTPWKRSPYDLLEPAEVIYVRPNHTSIVFRQAQEIARRKDFPLLPYGFQHVAFMAEMARRAEYVYDDLPYKTLVVACGSGVSLAGLLESHYVRQVNTIGVCVSSLDGVSKGLRRAVTPGAPYKLVKSAYGLGDDVPDTVAPFPCNPHWDLKAWHWLTQHVEELEEPILFWNLGGVV